jgi:hypothetical protein
MVYRTAIASVAVLIWPSRASEHRHRLSRRFRESWLTKYESIREGRQQ